MCAVNAGTADAGAGAALQGGTFHDIFDNDVGSGPESDDENAMYEAAFGEGTILPLQQGSRAEASRRHTIGCDPRSAPQVTL